MPKKKPPAPLNVWDRARSKLNRRVGTVDAVDDADGKQRYGLHYDEAPQEHYLTGAGHDSAQLPPGLIERA